MARISSRVAGAAVSLLAGLLAGGLSATQARASACTDLGNLRLELGGRAKLVSLTGTDMPASAPLPAVCAVSAVVSSSGNPSTSQIALSVWLPEAGWNGRYLGTGNGGFAGSISTGSLELGVAEGFATANTDMGTGLLFHCNSAFCGNHAGLGGIPGGLYGDAAAIRDFGYGATHLMTVAAKQIIGGFYGKNPTHSYFAGCSTGGQQALMESQRFPRDYDGILAGAPAHNRTHLHMAGASVYEATHVSPAAYLTNAALALVHAKVLKQCAGRDGGLATDDFLTQPASCQTDARVLQCTGAASEIPCTDPNAASCTCLTGEQAQAMDRDWSGAVDDHGRVLYPGAERGTEEPVPLTASNGYSGNLGLPWQQAGSEPAFDSLMFWSQGPNWTWQKLFRSTGSLQPELASEIREIDKTRVGRGTFAEVLNANSVDLSEFAERGGKLLMYHGYADPLIPSATSPDYYNAVAAYDRRHVGNYLRLFMAPGVWHCSSGPGANVFGGAGQLSPKPLDPSDDALGALIAWVEAGVAPTRITATKFVDDTPSKGIAFQRPLCLYPAHSAYVGGDSNAASSYACVAAPPVTNQQFSPVYGP